MRYLFRLCVYINLKSFDSIEVQQPCDWGKTATACLSADCEIRTMNGLTDAEVRHLSHTHT